jgi:quercetin dioxygenase-like cupin family protein
VSTASSRHGTVVAPAGAPQWFLGTLVRMKLAGDETGGRFALWEGLFPRGAAPPLHSHPQDETLYVIEGDVTAWIVGAGEAADAGDPPAWVSSCPTRGGAGLVAYAPGGVPHTFRVESDTARMLFLSTPAGIDDYIRALSEPAQWPWLPPPADGPRVAPERMRAVEQELQMIRHGPPPPPPESPCARDGQKA